MLLRVVHRRWYALNSHHFSHAVRPCKPPVLLHGKVTTQHRKTPYRAAQRLSAWVANRHQVQLLRSIRETKTAYLFRRVPLKNPEVYIFRAASQDRCTESGSGQQNKVRNFVPTLCEGVAFCYSLLHYLVSGCSSGGRPESWCRESRPYSKCRRLQKRTE